MMKFVKSSNFILFTLLVILLTFVYLFEEKRNQKEVERYNSTAIFQHNASDEILAINAKDFSLIKGDGSFYTSQNHMLVSQDRINEFFSYLSKLKVKRVLSSSELNQAQVSYDEKSLFVEFVFKNGSSKLVLGPKLSFDRSFYFKSVEKNDGDKNMNDNKLVEKNGICFYDAILPVPFTKENEHNHEWPYKEFQKFLSLKDEDFFELNMFKESELLKQGNGVESIWSSIAIENIYKEKYSLDLKNLITIPVPPSGIEHLKDPIKNKSIELLSLRAYKIIPKYDKSLLKNIIARVTVTSVDTIQKQLFFYREYGQEVGTFVTTDYSNSLYFVSNDSVPFVLSRVSDFWDKRVVTIRPEEFQELNDKSLTISSPQELTEESIAVNVILKGGSWSFESLNPLLAIRHDELLKFWNFIYQNEAQLCGKGLALETKKLFNFSFAGKKWSVEYLDGNLYVVDTLRSNYYLWFIGNNFPFMSKVNDFISTTLK